jgi:hypothetical protein
MTDELKHPIMPAGYDHWENNGDELNGGGVNEPVWPEYFDAFEGLTVLVLTPVLVDSFNDCPDWIMGDAHNVVAIPLDAQVLLVEEAG